MVLYNNPGRTGVHLEVDTVCQLTGHPRIVGIKDSTSDLSRPAAIRARIDNPHFHIFSGEDSTFVPFVASGGSGIISVQAGIVPMLYTQIWQAMKTQKWTVAQEYAQKLVSLHRAFSVASNPAPLKYAASLLGWGSDRTRFPLGGIGQSGRQAIEDVLRKLAPLTYGLQGVTPKMVEDPTSIERLSL